MEEERYREVWERAQPNHKFVSFPFQKKIIDASFLWIIVSRYAKKRGRLNPKVE